MKKEKMFISGNKSDKAKFEYYTNYFKNKYNIINRFDYLYKDEKKLQKKLLKELMDCDCIFIIDNIGMEEDNTITEINIAYNFNLKPIYEHEIKEGDQYAK